MFNCLNKSNELENTVYPLHIYAVILQNGGFTGPVFESEADAIACVAEKNKTGSYTYIKQIFCPPTQQSSSSFPISAYPTLMCYRSDPTKVKYLSTCYGYSKDAQELVYCSDDVIWFQYGIASYYPASTYIITNNNDTLYGKKVVTPYDVIDPNQDKTNICK